MSSILCRTSVENWVEYSHPLEGGKDYRLEADPEYTTYSVIISEFYNKYGLRDGLPPYHSGSYQERYGVGGFRNHNRYACTHLDTMSERMRIFK